MAEIVRSGRWVAERAGTAHCGRVAGAGAILAVCGLLGVGAAGVHGQGQPSAGEPTERSGPVVAGRGAARAMPVRIDHITVLHAMFGAAASQPFPPSATDSCSQSSSHSDFAHYHDPTGQTVVAQGGFVEGEWTAQSYQIPASNFPLKITTIETLFATFESSVQTTTHWTVGVWEGTPQTGTLVATYSSDGLILQPLVLPPGNAGGVIIFGVDPGAPEQIIVQNNGSNTFSVGFRVDQHHSQTSHGCTAAPPSCCNAFPATDISGLASPGGNWLYGLNCGSFGCPPNGGWAAFSSLDPFFCRPSGDWILRANWEPLNCTPATGACCLAGGACEVLEAAACSSQSGAYQGDNTACLPSPCPQPTGACCFSNNNCLSLTESDCGMAGGSWLGGGTTCSNGQCPKGACCLPDGQCVGDVTSVACTGQGGTFRGVGTDCATPCPQPSGACCLQSGGCLVLTSADCGQIPDAMWAGAFTQCSAAQCCYANCDGSTTSPILNVEDFVCFVERFSQGLALSHEQQVTHYANCDRSTTAPALNVEDFTCFVQQYAAGCP
jgi:hypothetical protein